MIPRLHRMVEADARVVGLDESRRRWSQKILDVLNEKDEQGREGRQSQNFKRFHIKQLYEALVGDVEDGQLNETDAMMASSFSIVTSNIAQRAVLDGYNMAPENIADQLVSPMPSDQRLETLSGFQALDDKSENTAESEEYPLINVAGEKAVQAPEPTKKGYRLPLTWEMIKFNKSVQFMSLASQLGEKLNRHRNIRLLRGIFDLTGYKRYYPWDKKTGTFKQVNLYRTAAGTNWYDRNITSKTGQTLVDDTQLNNARIVLTGRKDEAGEAISVNANTIVVPRKYELLMRKIISAGQFMVGNNSTNQTARLWANMNLAMLFGDSLPNVISSSLIDALNSDTEWFIGDPKRCFFEQIHKPLTVERASDAHSDNFNRDIVMQFKAGYKSDLIVADDTYWLKNAA